LPQPPTITLLFLPPPHVSFLPRPSPLLHIAQTRVSPAARGNHPGEATTTPAATRLGRARRQAAGPEATPYEGDDAGGDSIDVCYFDNCGAGPSSIPTNKSHYSSNPSPSVAMV
ncbi:unnamed protein product, partial [Urochloa humidicola]